PRLSRSPARDLWGKGRARGRRELPVVMTCLQPVGQREPGCWGGLQMHGGAASGGEGDARESPGRGVPGESSGELRYVRVEFAGGADGGAAILLSEVGGGTVLENVQVHASQGKGFHFRGGSVSCRRCVASAAGQSGVFWEAGWQGSLQHLYVQQVDADSSALHGVGGPEPAAGPALWNATLVGGPFGTGQHAGSGIRLEGAGAFTARNVVATGFRGHGVSASGTAAESLASGASSVANSIFHLNLAGAASPQAVPHVESLLRLPRLLNVRREPNPDPRPRSGSAALVPEHAAAPPFGGLLSSEAGYVGGFGRDNWLEEWTWLGGEEFYRAEE
ncbi:MAG: hypothetical protein OXN89_21835, partial [Bryobacterales bacterium]|nr:hypothetical protein [Bryobacterales bacterium]